MQFPAILSKLKALYQLDYDEGNERAEDEKTVIENANFRYDASTKVAANQLKKAQRRMNGLLGGGGGASAMADDVELGAPGGAEDMEDQAEESKYAEQEAWSPTLDEILDALPMKERLSALIHWYSTHPDGIPADEFTARMLDLTQRMQVADQKKSVAAEKRADAKRTPEAVLKEQLKRDPDVKAAQAAVKKEKKKTIVVEDDPDYLPPPPVSEVRAEPPQPMQIDPEIKEAEEVMLQAAAELKRKHEREEAVVKFEHQLKLAKIARDKADPPPPPKKGWLSSFQRG